MILEPREFLVYVKGKNSNEFEFKSDVGLYIETKR